MPLLIPLGARSAAAPTYSYAGTTAFQSGGLSTYSFSPGFLTGLTETWAVADAGGTLDGILNWDDYFGGHRWGIAGGTAVLNGGSTTAGGRVVNALPTSEHTITATIDGWHDSGQGVMAYGPCARMQGDASLTFIVTTLLTVDGVSTLIIQRFLNGSSLTIGGPVSVTPHAGMTIGTRVRGNQATGLFDNAVVIPAVSFQGIPTGTFWGMEGYMTVNNSVNVASISASVGHVLPLEVLSMGAFAGIR